MVVWVCIPVFNRLEMTVQCLRSLQGQTYRDMRIVVCDHGSTDGTSERIRSDFPEIHLIQASPDLWWTGATNRCVRYVLERGDPARDYVFTLNNDTELAADCLEVLVRHAGRRVRSIVCTGQYDIRDGRLVNAGLCHSWLTAKTHAISHTSNEDTLIAVTHAPGRGTLIPLRAFEELGLFDERRLPHYAADYDFTFRAARAGYALFCAPAAKVFSHVEATGLAEVRRRMSMREFVRYMTSIKSPANFRARFWLTVKNCPVWLVPTHLLLDLSRVLGSYLKYHFRSGASSRS